MNRVTATYTKGTESVTIGHTVGQGFWGKGARTAEGMDALGMAKFTRTLRSEGFTLATVADEVK